MGSDPQYASYPDLSLAQHIFQITNPSSSRDTRQASLKILQDAIVQHKMAPLYRHLAHPIDGVLNSGGVGGSQKAPSSPKSAKASGVANIVAGSYSGEAGDFPWDEKLYGELLNENEQELKTLDKEEEEAAEKAGETEVQAAKGKRAEFWARVGDKVRSQTSQSRTCTAHMGTAGRCACPTGTEADLKWIG